VKIQEILDELELNTGTFPRQALQQAIARRKQITPDLLNILEYAEQNVQELAHREGYMAHIYAMYLLAQFREKRAYPLIVRFFSAPGEISLELTGDVVTEGLGRILASVSGGDVGPMASLIENERANEYVRSAALDGLVTLFACGEKPRDEIVAYLQSLFRGKLARDYSFVWSGLVHASMRLYPGELVEDIERAFEDGLAQAGYVGFESVERALALGKQRMLRDLKEDRRYTFIEDTIEEMEWWACFDTPAEQLLPGWPEKIGRNDPCPCGSGKKYKRCCGRKRR